MYVVMSRAGMSDSLVVCSCVVASLKTCRLLADSISLETLYATQTHLERLSESQPRQHSGQGVPRDRGQRDDLVQSTQLGMPDPHQSEEVVSEVRARNHVCGGRQGLRVRKREVGGCQRRGHCEGPHRVDKGDQSGAVC